MLTVSKIVWERGAENWEFHESALNNVVPEPRMNERNEWLFLTNWPMGTESRHRTMKSTSGGKREGRQASDCSSRLCSNICKRETTGCFYGDIGTYCDHISWRQKADIFVGEVHKSPAVLVLKNLVVFKESSQHLQLFLWRAKQLFQARTWFFPNSNPNQTMRSALSHH